MAPPDRGDTPRRGDSLIAVAEVRLDPGAGSRLSPTANVLASWVEWLLHPEEHDYDRTVIYQNGEKREESRRITRANPLPGQVDHPTIDLPFESVIAQYNLLQFLDGMASVATQRVDAPDSLLALGGAAMKNVWWLGDKRMLELVHRFPSQEEWSGPAAEKARDFIGDLATATTQMNKIVQEFNGMAPQYAVIIKTAQDNFEKAAAELINAFQGKFYAKKENTSINVLGIILSTVAAGAVAYMTGGAALPIIAPAMVTAAWSDTFKEAGKVTASKVNSHGTVGGYWWRDLATSYMVTMANIRHDTIGALNNLRDKIEGLIHQFNADVKPFLDKYGI